MMDVLLKIDNVSFSDTVRLHRRVVDRAKATCSLMASAAASGKSRTKNAKGNARTKKTTFKVKQRRELLLVLEGNDYADLVDTTIQRLQAGTHLQRYPEREAFVSVICVDPVRPALVQCIMEMVAGYLEIYRENMKGKHYIVFEQRWFESINKFFLGTPQEIELSSQTQSWVTVVERSERNGRKLAIREQRIIVSTLAFIVSDLMATKVLQFKKDKLSEAASASNSSTACPVTVNHAVLCESNVALYRYGGFAIHTMIQKREKHMTNANHEIILLNFMKVKQDQWAQLPPAIQQLTKGGLDVPSPTLLPLLRKVVELTSLLVNDAKCKEHGSHMIKLAKQELDSCSEVKEIFDKLTASADVPLECKASVLKELVYKVFHSRVNEYMSASEEIELEQAGKAVKADQSLRDTLKTFSSIKSRSDLTDI